MSIWLSEKEDIRPSVRLNDRSTARFPAFVGASPEGKAQLGNAAYGRLHGSLQEMCVSTFDHSRSTVVTAISFSVCLNLGSA